MIRRIITVFITLGLSVSLNAAAGPTAATAVAAGDKSCVAQCRADFHQCKDEGQSTFFCKLEYALCLADCLIPGMPIDVSATVASEGQVASWVIEFDQEETVFVGMDGKGEEIAVLFSDGESFIRGSQTEEELSQSLVTALRKATGGRSAR